MKTKLSAVVSDFDDTLFLINDCIRAASLEILGKQMDLEEVKKKDKETKRKVYYLAHDKYWDKAVPNTAVINYINTMQSSGYDIIILSAKGEEHRLITERMLSSVGIKYKDVILPKDHSTSDEKWKLDEFNKLLGRYSNLVALEDKKENIDYILSSIEPKKIEFYYINKGEIKRYTRS